MFVIISYKMLHELIIRYQLFNCNNFIFWELISVNRANLQSAVLCMQSSETSHKLQWLNLPIMSMGHLLLAISRKLLVSLNDSLQAFACCSESVHVQNLFVYLPRFGQHESVFALKGVRTTCCVCLASTHYIQVQCCFFKPVPWFNVRPR